MDRVRFLTILPLVTGIFAHSADQSAHAGLVINDPQAKARSQQQVQKQALKRMREEIQADPEVLAEEEAPVEPGQTATAPNKEAFRKFEPRASATRPIPRVTERKTLVTQAPNGPSLNEIQLRKLAQASARPSPSPRMETQVIGEEPATRTKKTPSVPTEEPAAEPGASAEATAATGEPNAAFAYTHLLPSPMNVPGGTFIVGTNLTWGVTDFLQVSTNLLRDATRYWNAQAKVPLIEFPTFIASAHVSWDTFNLNNYDDTNPNLRVTSWQPGLVTGFEINEDMAFFVGGNFLATSTDIPKDGIRTSGFARGASLEVDWSWLYNPVGSRLSDNALSAGVKYDFTYKHLGFGVTHHWPSFQFGLHYVVNADRYRVLPILNLSVGFTL